MLFHLFHALREAVPGANVFRYVSTRIALATLTSLLITFIVAPWFIRRARGRHAAARGAAACGHAPRQLPPLVAVPAHWRLRGLRDLRAHGRVERRQPHRRARRARHWPRDHLLLHAAPPGVRRGHDAAQLQ